VSQAAETSVRDTIGSTGSGSCTAISHHHGTDMNMEGGVVRISPSMSQRFHLQSRAGLRSDAFSGNLADAVTANQPRMPT